MCWGRRGGGRAGEPRQLRNCWAHIGTAAYCRHLLRYSAAEPCCPDASCLALLLCVSCSVAVPWRLSAHMQTTKPAQRLGLVLSQRRHQTQQQPLLPAVRCCTGAWTPSCVLLPLPCRPRSGLQ